MTWWQITAWALGLALQLVGVFIALVGVASNHRDYKAPGEPWIFDWVFRTGRWIALRVANAWRWVSRPFHRSFPVSATVHATAAAGLAVGGLAHATGQVAYGELSPDLSVEERIAALDDRSRNDRDMLNRLELDLMGNVQHLHDLERNLEARAIELRHHTEDSLRMLATRGVKASAGA